VTAEDVVPDEDVVEVLEGHFQLEAGGVEQAQQR
jgi:hypothetical protein